MTWNGSITLACGHGWKGSTDSEALAQQFLDLMVATGDTAVCPVCCVPVAVVGPLVPAPQNGSYSLDTQSSDVVSYSHD